MAEYNDYINDIVKAKKVRFLFRIRVKDAVITLCDTEEIKLLPAAFFLSSFRLLFWIYDPQP